jgi:cytochrome b561
VNAPARKNEPLSEAAADALAIALFVGFVVLLFLGYLYPSIPYSGLSAIPLIGSLVTVFWTNLRRDRPAQSRSPR